MTAPVDALTTPESFGTVPKTCFEAARGRGAVLAIYPGKTYLITENTSAGVLLNYGGTIDIAAGVVFTFEDVVGPDNRVLFTGQGVARSKSCRYSVGWFGDGDLADAWDFCRRGFQTNVLQTCVLPRKRDGSSWVHTRPLLFDDPENRTVYTINCSITAAAEMEAQMVFSPVNKTEDITFWGKIDLDGADLATHGVKIRGGARIRFMDFLSGNRHLGDVLHINPENEISVDQFYASMVYGVSHGGYTANIIGGGGIILGLLIDHIFCNGVKPNGLGVANFEGFITGSTVKLVSENCVNSAGITSLPVDRSVVRVAAGDNYVQGDYRAPHALAIDAIWAKAHTKQLLSVERGGTETTRKSRINVGTMDRWRTVANTDRLASVEYCESSSFGFGHAQMSVATAVSIGASVNDVRFNNVDPYRVKAAAYTRVLVGGQCRIDTDLADDTAVTVIPNACAGLLNVNCGRGTWAVIAWRNDGTSAVVAKGDVDVTAGVLTTGVDGRFTIGLSGSQIYLENRTGMSRRVTAAV